MSGEVSDEELVERIRGLVAKELLRLGRQSAPRVEGRSLVVGKGAAEQRAELSGTLAQWDNLPEDLRERRVRQIAQLLVHEPDPTPIAPRAQRQRLSNRAGWLSIAAPVLVVLLTAAGVLFAYRYLSPNGAPALSSIRDWFRGAPSPSAGPPSSVDPDSERALLASSACEKARVRVSRGATISPTDVEGWQVELVLLRRGPPSDLAAAPALNPFIRRQPGSTTGTLIWPSAKSLLAEQRFDAQVEVRALPALGENQLSGLRVVFTGPYVVPYFTESSRSDYVKLADGLADALGATDGALFAHCEGSEAHHIGSWFLGASPSGAVASLVYFMADYSDAPILKPEVLGAASDPLRHGHAFDTIAHAATAIDRGAAATLIGRELGMISGRPNQPSRLSYPFRDSNRATRSSVDAARQLGLLGVN